jgi:protein-tyrosine phosphatase
MPPYRAEEHHQLDLELYPLWLSGSECVLMMPRPPADRLREAVARLRDEGVVRIVSLLEREEMDILGLAEEPAACAAEGIEFDRFPIRDGAVPADAREFAAFTHRLYQYIIDGGRVAIHCKAGVGRTGILTACLLRHGGWDGLTAIAAVSAARCFTAPETDAQCDFILRYDPACG